MDESLRRAAQEGNVSDLYKLIQQDGNLLKRFDKVEFVETPLHIAVAEGCIDFALEIMNLKSSFARKLNQQGLSPLHLAVDKGHNELVLLLFEIAKDLVRVKGKKGMTPFHYVITREENPEVLLTKILEDYPESIRDVTIENQTALHIAVRDNKEQALKLLCQMLRKTEYCEDVVNQKDRNGETALHIAARENRYKMIKVLLKCKANKYATNQAGSTALDVAQHLNNKESSSILSGYFFPQIQNYKYKMHKQIVKYMTKVSSVIFQDMDNISSEDRNSLLVILGLLLTSTFQASLSPPNGVGSSESIISSKRSNEMGGSITYEIAFLFFYVPTFLVFMVTFFLTLSLLKPFPRDFRTALQVLLSFLAICFAESIICLAPTYLTSLIIKGFSFLIFVLTALMCFAHRVSKISVCILGCWLLLGGPLFIVLAVLVCYRLFRVLHRLLHKTMQMNVN